MSDSLHSKPDWYRATLPAIGDAVITTDIEGRVTFLNPVAESLTGWTLDVATGLPLQNVFKIVNQETGQTLESPSVRALLDGVIVALAKHTELIARVGKERLIDGSASPLRNELSNIVGAVLVFRDIRERHKIDQLEDELRKRTDQLAEAEARIRSVVNNVSPRTPQPASPDPQRPATYKTSRWAECDCRSGPLHDGKAANADGAAGG